MNLFFVSDDVLCSPPCVLYHRSCRLFSGFVSWTCFSLFLIVFCVLVVLCFCSLFVLLCLLFVPCSLSLILTRKLLIASCWSQRKTSPTLPINQSPLDVLVYCVCSLFLKLFFVVDVVRWSCSGLFFPVLCLEIVVWGCLLLFLVLVIGALSSVRARCFYCCVWFACVLCLGSCLCSKKIKWKQRARIWNKEQEQ